MFRKTIEKLCKWRAIFAGWQLGTRLKGDPESDAVRDHREVTMLLRVEVNALAAVLIEKGVFTVAEFEAHIETEANVYIQGLEQRFPGAHAELDGMHIDIAKAQGWLKTFKP